MFTQKDGSDFQAVYYHRWKFQTFENLKPFYYVLPWIMNEPPEQEARE
jgi:hypothetical protein